MRKLAIPIMIIGLLVICYPFLEKAYSQYHEDRLLQEYEELLAAPVSYDSETIDIDDELDVERFDQEESEQPEEDLLKKHTNAIGIIRLPKLNVNLPILYEATDHNLRFAAAQLKGSTPIGETGNTAISAHRNYTDGRFFSNLDKLTTGDEVIIETVDGKYTYKVFHKTIVEPIDGSVLEEKGDEKILTLITCDPPKSGTHRLIVQAKILE